MTKRKIKHTCSECGESVYFETTAHWDEDLQCMQFSDDFSWTAYCGDCGAEDCLKVIDKDTGEELNTGPGSNEWVPLAEAKELWAQYHAEWKAKRNGAAL